MSGSIVGIGCDIVHISRIERLAESTRFLEKICTPYEAAYCMERPKHTLAGIWAAKEAVSKSLGTGFCGFTAKDIEVRHTASGQPRITLYRGAKVKAEELGAGRIQISISHESAYAIAFAVAESAR